MPLNARNKLEPVFIRHDHIGDDEVALPVLHPSPQRRSVARYSAPGSRSGPAPGSARCGSNGRRRRSSTVGKVSLLSLVTMRRITAGRSGVLKLHIDRILAQHREEQPELRASRVGCPPQLAHHDRWTILATSARPRPLPVGLADETKRIEQMRPDVIRDPRPVIPHRDHQRHMHALPTDPATIEPHRHAGRTVIERDLAGPALHQRRVSPGWPRRHS